MAGFKISNVSIQKLDEHDLKYFGDEELVTDYCMGLELLREDSLKTLLSLQL